MSQTTPHSRQQPIGNTTFHYDRDPRYGDVTIVCGNTADAGEQFEVPYNDLEKFVLHRLLDQAIEEVEGLDVDADKYAIISVLHTLRNRDLT